MSLLAAVVGAGFRTLDQRTLQETKDLIEAMDVTPTVRRILLINDLIRGLKASGVWTGLSLFYACAAHDEQAGRLNWKSPGNNTLTASNSPTFTAGKGFTGNGTNAYLDSGATLTGLSIGQDDVAIGAYCSISGGQQDTAIIGASGSHSARIYPLTTGNLVGTQLNDNTSAATAADGSGLGHVIASRSAAGQYERHKDGVTVLPAVVTSTGRPTGNVFLLRYSTIYTTHTVGIAHVGSSLTAEEAYTMQALCQTYMLGVAALTNDFNNDFNSDFG